MLYGMIWTWISMIGCTALRLRADRINLASVKADVLEIQGFIVDATERRGNPVGELSRLGGAAAHERLDKFIIFRAWQPFEFVLSPGFLDEHAAIVADEMVREVSDRSVKTPVRQGEADGNAR